MNGVTESQYSTIETLNIITSLLSLLGIISVLLMIISVGVFGYKKKRIALFHTISFNKLSFYIITFIFLSDFFRMIGHLLPSPSTALPASYSELTCRPGAFFKLFGSISTFLWMNITSYIVYRLLLYPHKFDKFYVERIKRIFHIISWPIALIISIIPLALQQYSVARSDGPWCFIDTHKPRGMVIAFFCYYLFLMVAWSVIILVYIAILRLLINDYNKAKKYNNDKINIWNHNNIITKVPTIQRLQFFPLIFIFCWFWEILSISYNKLQSNDLWAIKLTQTIFTNLYGLFNAILFFYVIYNYNSNEVKHRDPKTIGIRKKKKKKTKEKKEKKAKKSKSSKKAKPKKRNATSEVDGDKEEKESVGGVDVTNTTTTRQTAAKTRKTNSNYLLVPNNGKDAEANDAELSGPTVSLGVGNVSVMSPTSISTEERVKKHRSSKVQVIADDEDDEDDDEEEDEDVVVALSEDSGDSEKADGEVYEITEYDDEYRKNVTIGYNEDESDDEFYSGDDGVGNIDIVDNDEGEQNLNLTPRTPEKDTLLMEHEQHEELRYPQERVVVDEDADDGDDDRIEHAIVDEQDAYS
eukprot:CAMPEP_0197024262 /NCGR_PEP_ID=MMETSP1384-20130603/4849_1 /TAXON_ID=29189 /ORGANISM="Ammonia sp." /LENGTH=581 /DNA_ID=CAMNT_0042452619 /DNA_START=52 /DNA_END=1797 /DNA_ORIENTATION=-